MSSLPDHSIPGFTVAVSGHRWNKLSAGAVPRIARQLSSVFADIDDAVRREFKVQPRMDGGAPVLTLVCGLAEGADQIAVASRPHGWALRAILPFPRARYQDDFAPAHATGGVDRRAEFEAALAQAGSIIELPEVEDAVDGYERAGECMLRESDLLVAIWDGQPASGRGGTEAVISQAIAAAIPVIWIRSDRDEMPVLLSAADRPGQGRDAKLADASIINRTVAMIVSASQAPHPSPPNEKREL